MRGLNKAQKAEVDRIAQRKHGKVRPLDVLEVAEDESNPLHVAFDWDDTLAAQRWRLKQASDIIRVYVFVEPNMRRPLRGYVSLGPERGTNPGYHKMQKVLSSKQQRAAHLATALATAEEFADRYPELPEWEIIREAILAAVAKVRAGKR